MSWAIPLTDVHIEDDEIEAVLECLRGGWLTMGPRTQEFEHALADLYEVPHAVAVSSGTAALHLSMLAAGIGPGDEVLVPAMTFVAAAAAVRYCGATPVFVESYGACDLNLDPEHAAAVISPRTRAILATHWMGYPCDLTELERLCGEHDLVLLEDCAQSITARCADGRLTGTVGAAGCLSFFSKKQLSVGEGGMVITTDDEIEQKVRSLRSHAMTSVTWDRHRGHADSYDVMDVGFNFRIDEPRAALGLSRLGKLAAGIEHRRNLVLRYRERLSDMPGLTVPWDEEQVRHASHFAFPIVLDTAQLRDEMESGLQQRGVQTTWYPALTQLSAYHDHPRCPRTEDLSARHLALPLSATFDEERVDQVVDRVEEIVGAGAARPG